MCRPHAAAFHPPGSVIDGWGTTDQRDRGRPAPRTLLFSLLLLSPLCLPSRADAAAKEPPLASLLNPAGEGAEWTLIAAALGVSAWLELDDHSWPDEPVITTGETGLSLEKDTVPQGALLAGAGVLLALTALLPHDRGWLGLTAYANAKGFAEAVIMSIAATQVVKHAFGRRRPDYDERVLRGEDVDDGKLSFYSGHASIAFSAAVYFSLYVVDHVPVHVAARTAIALVLLGAASFVAVSRVLDHKHHPGDVLAGAAAGSAAALVCYGAHNGWFGKIYGARKGPKPVLHAAPGGAALTLTF